MGVKKKDAKRVAPNLYHRNPNTVRTRARKPFTGISHGMLSRVRFDERGQRWRLHLTKGWSKD